MIVVGYFIQVCLFDVYSLFVSFGAWSIVHAFRLLYQNLILLSVWLLRRMYCERLIIGDLLHYFRQLLLCFSLLFV